MAASRLVYSTAGDNLCPECKKPRHKCRCEPDARQQPGDGMVRIRRESKGRGGKEVTVITGLDLSAAELKALARRLKTACGSGGSIKNATLEIQGDQRDTVKALLEKAGFTIRLSGG